MPDPLEYIVKDALMMCDKGAAPGMFTPTYNTTTKVNGCLVSTKADKIPLVNIPTFGACACKSGAPCTPTPVEWLDTYKAKVKGQETVLYRCKLPCGSGGKIEFITSGQVPLPPEEYDKLLEEHGEEEDGLSWWDGAELIPFAGGIIGTVRSGAKGDWLGVGLSVASVGLDVAGLFSFGGGNAASAAVKGGKLARTSVKVAGAMTKAGKAMRLTGKAAKAFASAAAKSVDNIALKTGKICVFACFPAGTPVSVKDGYKNVEDIEVGDLVWAYNEETGESDLKPVVNTIQNEVDATVKITLEDEIIESTVEHPFYTRGGWKDAADLTTEDEVKTKSGTWSYIKKIAFEYQKKKVYNFEVGGWHTYFVGTWSWLVHNTKKVCLSKTLSLLKYWKPKTFRVGDTIIRLDKKAMTHIVERHLKGFRNSADKATQTVLKNMSPRDIERAIGEVIKQNRGTIMNKAATNPRFWGQIEGVVDGVKRTVGFKNGNIGQFY